MRKYQGQKHVLAAVDCIIFGFDGIHIKLLLVRRTLEPFKDRWTPVAGFLRASESLEEAADRVLFELTGMKGVYMEQLRTYSDPGRDPVERTISTVFTALIDIHKYQEPVNLEYDAEWFPIRKTPALIFDHMKMVRMAKQKLKYQASLHPLLFELLPDKFTIPQLQILYEDIFGSRFDKRNFSRKVLSTGLLVKMKEKDKSGSRKGAFYFKLNKKLYKAGITAFMNLIPNPDKFLKQ